VLFCQSFCHLFTRNSVCLCARVSENAVYSRSLATIDRIVGCIKLVWRDGRFEKPFDRMPTVSIVKFDDNKAFRERVFPSARLAYLDRSRSSVEWSFSDPRFSDFKEERNWQSSTNFRKSVHPYTRGPYRGLSKTYRTDRSLAADSEIIR